MDERDRKYTQTIDLSKGADYTKVTRKIKRTGRSAGMLPMPAGFDNYFDEDNEMIASLFEGAG